jgi:hypothetical protein
VEPASGIRQFAFPGNYLPRKRGIAAFTSDLLSSLAAEHPESQCFAVPVTDIPGGSEYPGVAHLGIEEQASPSCQRAADFLNLGNADIACVRHEFGICGGPAGGRLLALLRELQVAIQYPQESPERG